MRRKRTLAAYLLKLLTVKMNCTICQKTNHHPNGVVVVVATFPQPYFAKNVLENLEKAHIQPVWSKILSQNVCTLIIELHGIRDILQLESLYIESMCRESNALTIDILTTKNSYDKLLQELQANRVI